MIGLPGLSKDSQSLYTGADPAFAANQAMSGNTFQAVRQAKSQNAIVLQVLGDRDPIRVLPLPGEGQSVLVSDLLRQAGLATKFSSMNVVVFRSATGMPGGIRMEVRMEGKGDGVQPATDYALQAGDRIQVAKSTSDVFEGMLSATFGL